MFSNLYSLIFLSKNIFLGVDFFFLGGELFKSFGQRRALFRGGLSRGGGGGASSG